MKKVKIILMLGMLFAFGCKNNEESFDFIEESSQVSSESILNSETNENNSSMISDFNSDSIESDSDVSDSNISDSEINEESSPSVSEEENSDSTSDSVSWLPPIEL